MVAVRFFDIPFAIDGDLTAVPDGVQSNGSVSYTQGYGINYSTPVAGGGLNFPRTQHNQLLNDITTALQQYQMNGVPLFYAGMSVAPFTGYPKYARVLQSDGNVYISLIADNTDVPPSSNWQISNAGTGIPENPQAGATYAPDAGDSGKIIVRSDSGSNMTDTLPGTAGALGASWYAYYGNSDASGIVTVGVGSGGTIAVGKQATANKFNVAPGDMWLVISLGSGNYIANRIGEATLHAQPVQGGRKNLKVITTSNTASTITADSLVVNDAAGNGYRLEAVNESYATGTAGAGGLDTGSIAASTWYNEFIIFDPATDTQNSLLSLSATAPALPTGYTAFARVGAIRTDASSHLQFKDQDDEDAQSVVGTNPTTVLQMASGTAGNPATSGLTYVGVAVAPFVPPTASRIRGILASFVNSQTIVAPNNSYGSYQGVSNCPVSSTGGPSYQGNLAPFDFAIESADIYWASNSASGFLGCYGWKDNL